MARDQTPHYAVIRLLLQGLLVVVSVSLAILLVLYAVLLGMLDDVGATVVAALFALAFALVAVFGPARLGRFIDRRR
jgi:hypothetical protein